MLDVMKTPPPVIEQITWTASRVQMPDDAETLLMYCPEDEDDPVHEGWFDSANDQWLNIEGFPIGMVTWWAKKPMGPTEPKPGQVQDVRELVQATLDQLVTAVYGAEGLPSTIKRHHLQWIVGTALTHLGRRAEGGKALAFDMEPGRCLLVQVKKNGEVPT